MFIWASLFFIAPSQIELHFLWLISWHSFQIPIQFPYSWFSTRQRDVMEQHVFIITHFIGAFLKKNPHLLQQLINVAWMIRSSSFTAHINCRFEDDSTKFTSWKLYNSCAQTNIGCENTPQKSFRWQKIWAAHLNLFFEMKSK